MPLSREDLLRRVEVMHEIFSALLEGHRWQMLGHESRQQLTTGVNKAYGQAMAFQHEYASTMRAYGKGRHVDTQLRGDVTVGQPQDPFAKTIECKSITAPDKGSVNAAIRKAIEQLAGQTGHMPRDGDVRVMDVVIEGNRNPWPMNGGDYDRTRDPVPRDTLIDYALLELEDLILRSNAQGATDLRNWIAGQVQFGFQDINRLGSLEPTTFPNSSRLWAQGLLGPAKVRCLTVKIRYEDPYPLPAPLPMSDDPLWERRSIEEMVFQVYKNVHGQTVVEIRKIKEYVVDLMTNTSESRRRFG